MASGTQKSLSSTLLNLIGIPNVRDSSLSELASEDVPVFLKIAEKNKVPLLYLETIKSKIVTNAIKSSLLTYETKYENTQKLTRFVGSLLESINVPYTFFKTVKPFPYVPSDVDVLLWSDVDLKKVVKSLKHEGCKILDGDAYGVTMYSPLHDLNIDLTTQVAVSGLVYLDKHLLRDHVNELKLSDSIIRTLSPSADLLVVAAHSLYKEQMLTLSDYYNLIIFKEHWEEASKLAKKFHMSYALKLILAMAGSLTLDAFGSLDFLKKEFDALDITHVQSSKANFELPVKYSLNQIMVAFFKKLATDPSTVNSLPSAIRCVYNPAFYLKALEHVTRKRY